MTDEDAFSRVKVLLAGGPGVGKTCLVQRYVCGTFKEYNDPLVNYEYVKLIEAEGHQIHLTVIDENNKEQTLQSIHLCQAYMFILDITNKSSIQELDSIYNEIKANINENDDFIYSICVNKTDVLNENNQNYITEDQIKEIEAKYSCDVIQTSAKMNSGVDDIFSDIVLKYIHSYKPYKYRNNAKSMINYGLHYSKIN